ncbi:hypothetical protein KCP77_09880 [Salmonella enterica subsp. enterica]|nr:hypothetical protein KCP77_09880 [Salmonella enterica subsp. enterica]
MNGQNINLVRDKDGAAQKWRIKSATLVAYPPDDGVQHFSLWATHDGAGKCDGSAPIQVLEPARRRARAGVKRRRRWGLMSALGQTPRHLSTAVTAARSILRTCAGDGT